MRSRPRLSRRGLPESFRPDQRNGIGSQSGQLSINPSASRCTVPARNRVARVDLGGFERERELKRDRRHYIRLRFGRHGRCTTPLRRYKSGSRDSADRKRINTPRCREGTAAANHTSRTGGRSKQGKHQPDRMEPDAVTDRYGARTLPSMKCPNRHDGNDDEQCGPHSGRTARSPCDRQRSAVSEPK